MGMALAAALTPDKIKLYDRETWAKRWHSLYAKLQGSQATAVRIATNLGVAGTTTGTFAVAYYARKRLQLAGKRVTFDAAGRIDGFFWPGLALTIVGSTPVLKEAGPFAMGAGIGMMCAGVTGVADQLAKDHHAGSTITTKAA
jgi:hypothetical protein